MKQQIASKNASTARLLFSKALSLHQAGNIDEAKKGYSKILKLIPLQPDALHMLGVTEFQQKRYQQAVDLINQAKTFRADSHLVHFNLGNALRSAGRLEEACEAYRQAIKLNPNNIEAQKNIGNVLKEQNLMAEAIRYYDKILEKDPYHAYTLYNKSIALLSLGRLAEGWDLYEHRLSCDTSDAGQLGHSFPRYAAEWTGDFLEKPLLVLPEQGLGDQIFYGAMLHDLQGSRTEAFVCLDGRLHRLFKRSFPNLDFILPTELSSLDPSDNLFGAQIQLASLGRIFRRSLNDFSRIQSPFLFVNQALSTSLAKSQRSGGNLICGLSWASNSPSSGKAKSIKLAALGPILKMKGFKFINLQYGDTNEECRLVSEKFGVDITRLNEIDNHNDIDELAALITTCDVVVTVSNSTAHLAAALGKPVVVLLPHHSPLWYWHIDSPTSPWYPTVTLVRQDVAGDWQKPINAAASLLHSYINRSVN